MLHYTRTYIACIARTSDLLIRYSDPLDGLNLITYAHTKY